MSKQIRVSHPIYNPLPTEIEGFNSLAALALDMCWLWNHVTYSVWRQLDPVLWKFMHNTWVVLQTVSRQIRRRGFSRIIRGHLSADIGYHQMPARQVVYSKNILILVWIVEGYEIQSNLCTDYSVRYHRKQGGREWPGKKS